MKTIAPLIILKLSPLWIAGIGYIAAHVACWIGG